MEPHKLARHFHALGLLTFPVRWEPNKVGKYTKRPAMKWAETPIPARPQHWKDYGVRLDRRYVVIDVDVKNGKTGAESFLAMRALLTDEERAVIDNINARFICATQTGGKHHWFRLPEGMRVRYSLPEFKDVEFLSEGHYVVGPGTHFAGQAPYAILSGAIDDDWIPELPRTWQILLEMRETEWRAEPADYTNSETALRQFREYCQTCPPAVQHSGRNNAMYRVALQARDLGVDPEHTFRIMLKYFNPRCQPPYDEGTLDTVIQNAHKYGKATVGAQNYSHLIQAMTDSAREALDQSVAHEGYSWRFTRTGALAENDENNTICFLVAPSRRDFRNELWGLFRFNAFTNAVEYAVAPPWFLPEHADAGTQRVQVPTTIDDAEVGALRHYLFQKYEYTVERPVLYNAIDFVARQSTYHPIRTWLKGLEWDGVPRLDTWLSVYCETPDSQYARYVGSFTLMGAVARILEPGCKQDYTMILEGDQGGGKSKVGEILAVRPEWHAVIPPDIDKDTRQVLSRKWIVEFAEIDQLSRHAASAVKAFMATAVDTYRPPYGRAPISIPRQSVFIGTVNPNASGQYLTDETGGRRYWPVATGYIDEYGLREAVPQLYAEALVRHMKGELRYVTADTARMFDEEVRKRYSEDPLVAKLREWQEKTHTPSAKLAWLATNIGGIQAEWYNRRERNRLIAAISYLGWRIGGRSRDVVYPANNTAWKVIDHFATLVPAYQSTLLVAKRLTYTGIAQRWNMGPLSQAQKRSIRCILEKLPGVAVDHKNLREVTFIFRPMGFEL